MLQNTIMVLPKAFGAWVTAAHEDLFPDLEALEGQVVLLTYAEGDESTCTAMEVHDVVLYDPQPVSRYNDDEWSFDDEFESTMGMSVEEFNRRVDAHNRVELTQYEEDSHEREIIRGMNAFLGNDDDYDGESFPF